MLAFSFEANYAPEQRTAALFGDIFFAAIRIGYPQQPQINMGAYVIEVLASCTTVTSKFSILRGFPHDFLFAIFSFRWIVTSPLVARDDARSSPRCFGERMWWAVLLFCIEYIST